MNTGVPGMTPARAIRLERLYEAVALWVHVGNEKVLHVLTCADCEQTEKAHDTWCAVASGIGRRQLEAAQAMRRAADAVETVSVTP